jgi:murein DD-endopeptidase MepM/ murein hydrolase activator NlpD
MTYLFSNPQAKKWKTLFFLSLMLNIIILVAFFMREQEVATVQKREVAEAAEKKIEETSSKTLNENKPDVEKTAKPEKDYKQGDLLDSSVTIEDNFFSAFNSSEDVKKLSEKTGIDALSDILSAHVGRLLVWKLVLRTDVRKGDSLSFVFREIPDEEAKNRIDIPDELEVVAIDYHSKKYAKNIRIFLYKQDGEKYARYYYDDGMMIEKIISDNPPVKLKDYIQVTSLIGDRMPKHDGVDFKAVIGTKIYSPVDGTVLRKNWKTKYNGYCLEIKDSNGRHSYKFLHLSDVIVKQGQKVSAGDHVANTGNTGKTTAPHLHYQINVGQKGKVLDPYKFHETKMISLEGKELSKFKSHVKKMSSYFKK